MHKAIAAIGLASLGLASMGLAVNTVSAAEPVGGYVGASIGESNIEDDDIDFDEGDTAFKIFGGYAFHPNFAVELAYVDAGSPRETAGPASLEVEAKGIIGSAVGRIPLGDIFTLFGKVGFAHYDIDATVRFGNGTVLSDDDSDTDIAYGLGAQVAIGARFAVRAEYEMIDIEDGDFSFLSVGGLFKF